MWFPAAQSALSLKGYLWKQEGKQIFLNVQLKEAEAFLRAAGVELPIEMSHRKSKNKDKEKSKTKKSKKHKKERSSKDG